MNDDIEKFFGLIAKNFIDFKMSYKESIYNIQCKIRNLDQLTE